jgi:hypothetical protein
MQPARMNNEVGIRWRTDILVREGVGQDRSAFLSNGVIEVASDGQPLPFVLLPPARLHRFVAGIEARRRKHLKARIFVEPPFDRLRESQGA